MLCGLERQLFNLCWAQCYSLPGVGQHCQDKTTELNGSQIPEDQGWLVSTNAVTPYDVATNGSTVTINTIGVLRSIDQAPSQKAVMWFYKEVPYDFDRDSPSSLR